MSPRIAAFGDTHLAHLARLDKFRGDEDRLLGWADHLEAMHDRIVLLGDLYQTDYGGRPGSRSEVLARAIERWPRISARWREPPYVALFGNHDRVLAQAWGAREEVLLEEGGTRLWFVHGHQFDPLVRDGGHAPWVTWSIGGMRRLGLRLAGDFLEESLFAFLQGVARPLGAPDRTGVAALRDGRADVVVMAHTHRTRWRAGGHGVYANPGGCLDGTLRYASIDVTGRVVEIRRLTAGGPLEVVHRARMHAATPTTADAA